MLLRSDSQLIVDLDLPPSLPTRYRVRLASLSRLEVRIRFAFEPRVFRTREVDGCGATLTATFGGQTVQLDGALEPEAGGSEGRLRFAEPIALPEYALLRRAWAAEEGSGDVAALGTVVDLTAAELEEAPLDAALTATSA